ncbi:MAG: alkaline phosphatase family protein, partial [Bacteroidota bacterium]
MKVPVKIYYLCIIFFLSAELFAQDLSQAGPMVGYSAMREVVLWVQTKAPAKVKFLYWNINDAKKKFSTQQYLTKEDEAFTAKLICDQLEPGQK